jgi:large conductance mechanosensitive channel
MSGFVEFLRKQGVVGLAVGFILGGAISKLVAALVSDIINPIIGVLLGKVSGLTQATIRLGSARIMWGDFVSVLIDFLIIAAVVYFGVKWLKLDKLDKRSSKQ